MIFGINQKQFPLILFLVICDNTDNELTKLQGSAAQTIDVWDVGVGCGVCGSKEQFGQESRVQSPINFQILPLFEKLPNCHLVSTEIRIADTRAIYATTSLMCLQQKQHTRVAGILLQKVNSLQY